MGRLCMPSCILSHAVVSNGLRDLRLGAPQENSVCFDAE